MSVQQRHWIRARRERGTAHMIADHSDRFAHRGAHLPTAQPPGGDSSTVGSVHRRTPATNTFCAAPCAPSRRLSRQQGAESDANRWQSFGWPASMGTPWAAPKPPSCCTRASANTKSRSACARRHCSPRHHSDKKKCEPRDRRMHSLSSVLVDIPRLHALPPAVPGLVPTGRAAPPVACALVACRERHCFLAAIDQRMSRSTMRG